MLSVIVFDADNTLWDTNALYVDAGRWAQAVLNDLGADVASWKPLQRVLDRDLSGHFQLGKEQFPASMVLAYELVNRRNGTEQSSAVRDALWEIGMSVFERPAPTFDGVPEMLAELATLAPLALITKGHEEVQRARIEHSGLAQYFSYVGVVERADKQWADFQAALDALGGKAEASWSVGDSVASDIVPAEQLGFRTVLFSNPTWLLEHSDEVPATTVTVTTITDTTAVVREALQLRSDVARINASDDPQLSL
jgi:putative hydrolase of the HAD superfamily